MDMTTARQGARGRIVVALDKFKGSLSADRAVDALAGGLESVLPETMVIRAPIADGGDGTVDAAVRAGYTRHAIEVTGAMGQRTTAVVAQRGSRVVVEVANASGGAPRSAFDRDPLGAHTFGVGQAILAALDLGASEIVVGLGGSISTDGGTGMVRALGGRFLDCRGEDIPLGGAGLLHLDHIDLSLVDSRVRTTRFVLAADVDNPLLGPFGCASVFAPQKGADPAAVEQLESALARLAEVARTELNVAFADDAGSGAAGGVGFAGLTFLGAHMDSGASVVLELIDLRAELIGADLVITGEGQLDSQSLRGKAPVAVAAIASETGVPAVAVVGTSQLDANEVRRAGFRDVYPLTDVEPDIDIAKKRAEALLFQIGQSFDSSTHTFAKGNVP